VTAIFHVSGSPVERSRRLMHYTPQRLTDGAIVALDTEATGIFLIVHRLVEVGAVRFRLEGRELATFQTLIDPQMSISEDVP
jgi:DNA polymerase III alpha subunit (gram-positive type)